jgi:hypothetical protein
MPGVVSQRYARDRELFLNAQARGDIPPGCVLHMRMRDGLPLFAYWPKDQNGDRYYIDPQGNVEFEQRD